jgi:sigma-E factor negative regulatory protein RseC
MESANGRISALCGTSATVVVSSPLACRRCAAGKGCGAGIFQDAAQSRQICVEIPPDMVVQVGDNIEIAIASRHLLRAAMLAYALPLMTMLISLGALWALSDTPGDGQGIVIAVSGLAAGFAVSRWLLKQESVCEQFVPVIREEADVAAC